MSGSPVWPAERLSEVLEGLAKRTGGTPGGTFPPPPGGGGERLAAWVDAAARHLGLEAEPIEVPYPEVSDLLARAAPMLLRLPGEPAGFLTLVGGNGRRAELLLPSGGRARMDAEEVRRRLCRPLEEPFEKEMEGVLARAEIDPRRRPAARQALLGQALGETQVEVGWLLRLPPGAAFRQQLRQAGLVRSLASLLLAHGAQYLLWLISWWLIGWGALAGRLQPAWIAAWALLLLTLVPLRAAAGWLQGKFAANAGALLKRRLFQGVLRLEPDEVRRQGAGQLLARVLESEAVESLALSGGFRALVAVVELVFGVAVLALGAGGALHVVLFAAWMVLAALALASYYRRRREWAGHRLELTHDLVERMNGHRTRLAQERPERWHDGEDEGLSRYQEISRAMDRRAVTLDLLPAGWLLAGLFGLAPALLRADASPAALAVGLGGVLLARQALSSLVSGTAQLADAAISWRQIADLFAAAQRPEARGAPELSAAAGNAAGPGEVLIEAHDLGFAYSGRSRPVLEHCHLTIRAGDRLLLEGRSGSGKSTLAAVLSGMRLPGSGLLLAQGLDRRSLGDDGWRRVTAAAPQFHENHVLTETLAFNLLMGRGWPPKPGDFEEAEEVCRELGLGDLLDRMPGGLQQVVGESGWQLSHGERSRLFLARALLQGAPLLVLDESFAALDPSNLQRALRSALNRAPALLVIAHP